MDDPREKSENHPQMIMPMTDDRSEATAAFLDERAPEY
jgi:hypothetical protein